MKCLPGLALPVDEVLPELFAALSAGTRAVLVAPPGAGKTTRIPIRLLDAPWLAGRRIVMLEPRRLAARGAADWMARGLGEALGGTVGLRVRADTRVSAKTRIEVVTEGVFTRMILDDPSLDGIGAVIFDEFHERSLDADLGLALAIDAQAGLREDLRLLVMSATLDGARVARLLGDAPVIRSEGRAFPVETRHLGRRPERRIEDEVTDAIVKALREEAGSCLVFLPGAGEIRRVAERLADRLLDPDIDVVALHGALDRAEQDRAIRPPLPGRRKVVLATSIAETSLTIEGVRIVVDCGLARVPVYEPGVGLTRLETVRVSRAAADQRRGRAGRTAPGFCYRLWEEAATGSLEPFARPEILSADLAPLLLDCAEWGVIDPATLPFLDPPPAGALQEGRALLAALDALGADGRITEMGRKLRALPLPPRLARMVLEAAGFGAASHAADLAALLVERGLGGTDVDLDHRMDRFRRDGMPRSRDMRRLAQGWAALAARLAVGRQDACTEPSTGALVALAYPDRIAKARGAPGDYVLAGGRGAHLEPHLALAREPYLAIAEITGRAGAARIVAASAITLAEIEQVAGDRIVAKDETVFDTDARALRSRSVRSLGAVTLSERPRPVPREDASAAILARGVAELGLATLPGWDDVAGWQDRVAFLREGGDPDWPDLSDAALAGDVETWLAPHLVGRVSLTDIPPHDVRTALEELLPWPLRNRLDQEAPSHLEVPTGSRIAIAYGADGGPAVSVRVQELFGLTRHPTIASGRVPLVLHLLSPAQRPIQVTRDLPGFWRGSWAAVRSEMRGRYPRHPWPDDPATAEPTRRVKPRGT